MMADPDNTEIDAFEIVTDALADAGMERGTGDDWVCPAHDDHKPSLGVTRGKPGEKEVLIFCPKCTPQEVLNVLDLPHSLLARRRPALESTTDNNVVVPINRGTPKVPKEFKSPKPQVKTFPPIKDAKSWTYGPITVFRWDTPDGKILAQGLTEVGRPSKIKDKVDLENDVPLLYQDEIEELDEGSHVWICEGETKVDALRARKQHATTQFMGGYKNWLPQYTPIFEGLKVTVWADTDQVGYARALRVHDALKGVAAAVRVVRTDLEGSKLDAVDHFKAGHTLKDVVRISIEDLRVLATPAGEKDGESVGRHVDAWVNTEDYCAHRFVAEEYMQDGHQTLCWWRDTLYEYRDCYWSPADENVIYKKLWRKLEDVIFETKDGEHKQIPMRRARGRDMFEAVKRIASLRPADEEPEHQGYIYFRNGALDLARFTESNGADVELLEHTPARFNLSALAYDFREDYLRNRKVLERKLVEVGWLPMLRAQWQKDDGGADLLQEWFGYVVSGDTRAEKALYIQGESRTGKGTILEVLQLLVGTGGTSVPSIGQLNTEFGMESLVGKSSLIVADARWNSKPMMDRFNQIVSNETMSVNRKNKTHWNGRLGVRVTMASNETIDVTGENSKAVSNRLLLLDTPNSFAGREDFGLKPRLMRPESLEAVMVWALLGYARLARNGFRFTESTRGEQDREQVQQLSPVAEFLADCCEIVDHAKTPASDLWLAWESWRGENGYSRLEISKRAFNFDLRRASGGRIENSRTMNERVMRNVKLAKRAFRA